MAETAWEANTKDNRVSTEGPGHHQLVPSQYKGGGRGKGVLKDVVWW